MEPEISFDNCTVMGRFHDYHDAADLIAWALSNAHNPEDPDKMLVRVGVSRIIGPGIVQRVLHIDNAHLTIDCAQESGFFVEKQDDRPNPVRFEFNPNRASEIVWTFFNAIEVAKVSRLDVAIDYQGRNVSDYLFTKPRVKARIHRGAGVLGDVQTVYLGAPTSRKCIRIYNKALELGITGVELTRIEGLSRHDAVLSEDLFDGFQILNRGIPDGLKTRDAALCALMLHYPERLDRADKETRRKVLNLMELDPSDWGDLPSEIYRSEIPVLRQKLDSMITSGYRPKPCSLYQNVAVN
jgi:hypothetical protein